MTGREPTGSGGVAARLAAGRRSIGFKLFGLLAALLVVSFSVMGWLFERGYRNDLEQSVVDHGTQMGDLVKQATFQAMRTGDRSALTTLVQDIGQTQGVEGVWIYNKAGQAMFSNRAGDVGKVAPKTDHQCAVCHVPNGPALPGPRSRYLMVGDRRVLGLTHTIDNSTECANAACHAHDASTRMLGVLDIQLPIDTIDQAAAATRRRIALASLLLIGITAILSWAFIHRVVNRPMSDLLRGTRKLTAMDLDAKVEVHSRDEVGEVAETFNAMVDSLRSLVSAISATSVQINSAAAELFAASRQQEQGATQQSSAAEETRRTMEGLVTSARQIAESTLRVLENAEMTLEINKVGAERTRKLAQHTQRIVEILENIKDISNRSEILALNAALEGAKAGEVGRGFSLVAAQMQRLAENVADSVKGIKSLVGDIRDATSATVLATEEGAKLAGDMTDSARRINLITGQQEGATTEVSKSMGEVAHIGLETVAASKQIAIAAGQLTAEAETLRGLVQRFRLSGLGETGGG